MRGKLKVLPPNIKVEGNIPAYAGKTITRARFDTGEWEHPRVCGENNSLERVSSRVCGNIPAYAGKTHAHANPNPSATEHPRVCGENGFGVAFWVGLWGTSPRMRGKRKPWWGSPTTVRNIPAYAGKTITPCFSPSTSTEHPRVCGENETELVVHLLVCGTSPRMRGKPYHLAINVHILRNIPAYAGKTPPQITPVCTATEHPRVCGENRVSPLRSLTGSGTSPRMRGKPDAGDCGSGAGRNIPAYAGKTHPAPTLFLLVGEHPRVCGENPWIVRQRFTQEGTSPRMRGKHGKILSVVVSDGNIPAYAGKT